MKLKKTFIIDCILSLLLYVLAWWRVYVHKFASEHVSPYMLPFSVAVVKWNDMPNVEMFYRELTGSAGLSSVMDQRTWRYFGETRHAFVPVPVPYKNKDRLIRHTFGTYCVKV